MKPMLLMIKGSHEHVMVFDQMANADPDASNFVFHKVVTVSGKTQGVIYAPYDGTKKDALRVAGLLHAMRDEAFASEWDDWNSHSNSQTLATNAMGLPKWRISPNRCHVTAVERPGVAHVLDAPDAHRAAPVVSTAHPLGG